MSLVIAALAAEGETMVNQFIISTAALNGLRKNSCDAAQSSNASAPRLTALFGHDPFQQKGGHVAEIKVMSAGAVKSVVSASAPNLSAMRATS